MIPRNLLVIVPTRGRPDSVLALESSLHDTQTSVADVLYVVDPDDAHRDAYLDNVLGKGRDGQGRIVVLPQRLGLTRTLNSISARFADRYDSIGFMGDDHRPRTVRWDRMITNELYFTGSGPRVVYGNDLLQRANLPTAVFMHTRIIETLGYMVPLTLKHLYADNFWKELGEGTGGLRYRDDVVIEHMHPAAGKAEWDAGYREVNSPQMDSADRNAWLAYRENSLALSVQRVKEAYEK
jgi:hypothetical protein